jgi:peptidoglycan/LPS O-acetylase OafA/YrhL
MTNHQTNVEKLQGQLSNLKLKVQFPGLNTIRLYAALAVIIEHVSIQFSAEEDLFQIVKLFFPTAQSAVNLFFVLSGFLITYLLLNERATTGQVNIRNFYIRRTLRIWPLYYWVALLGLVIFPILFGQDYPLTNLPPYKLVLAFGLLPNFAGITAPMIHLWSIGVEEQFYASWPWANRSDIALLRTIFGILVIKLLLTPVILSFNNENITKMFYGLRFECMAIGALGAYLYSNNLHYLKWIYHPWIQLSALGAFVYLSISNVPINTYNAIWSSLVYLVLIMNVATNPHSFLQLNSLPVERLGEISYGLYLYHFPILYLIYFTTHQAGFENVWNSPLWLLLVTLASTWAIAALSYRWFEKPFLDLKKRFTAA